MSAALSVTMIILHSSLSMRSSLEAAFQRSVSGNHKTEANNECVEMIISLRVHAPTLCYNALNQPQTKQPFDVHGPYENLINLLKSA
jgi:hypothetical protein